MAFLIIDTCFFRWSWRDLQSLSDDDRIKYVEAMKHKQTFESIFAIMAETDWNSDKGLEYESICHDAGVSPDMVDNMFFEHFGLSGTDMISVFRKGLGSF